MPDSPMNPRFPNPRGCRKTVKTRAGTLEEGHLFLTGARMLQVRLLSPFQRLSLHSNDSVNGSTKDCSDSSCIILVH